MAKDLSDGNRRLAHWPFFVFGFLSPFSRVGEQWMPRYLAEGLGFFVLFAAAAAFAAARLSRPPQNTGIERILLGSAVGAALGGGLRYLFS